MTKLSAKAQASLDKVIAKFEAGDLSPITRAARIQLDAEAPASKWSFSNRVLAYAQSGELDCRGYRQWQKFGRHVKKGSHAAFIFTPRTKKVEKDGKEETCLIGFGTVAVFAAADTEGATPLPDYTPAELPPLTDVAEKLGVQVNFTPTPADRLGDCDIDGTEINIGSTDPAVFFHELAHAAHAKVESLTGGQTSKQETVAEFTAAVLMDMYHIRNHTGNAWKYISHYNPDPVKAITKALSLIEKVVALLTA